MPVLGFVIFIGAILAGIAGIVGNVLSAIVWLRRQVASKNSSAIYLAAIAINDLIHIITLVPVMFVRCNYVTRSWICIFIWFTHFSSYALEPLLVLGFSAERLFAVRRPIQVSSSYARHVHVLSFYYAALHAFGGTAAVCLGIVCSGRLIYSHRHRIRL